MGGDEIVRFSVFGFAPAFPLSVPNKLGNVPVECTPEVRQKN